jgi:hypothetical protein
LDFDGILAGATLKKTVKRRKKGEDFQVAVFAGLGYAV